MSTSTTLPAALTTQVYQVFIKSDAQKIWDAITQPEFTRRYFHGSRIDTTAVPGEPIRYYGPDGDLWVDGVVFEADAPHRLVVSWSSLYNPETAPEPRSRVTWTIEERDGGLCLLRAVHDQLENSPKTAQSVSGEGWTMVLSGLKTLLETGAPLVSPS
jgi:uncharacterized protein YndB with AHSA1/START domain